MIRISQSNSDINHTSMTPKNTDAIHRNLRCSERDTRDAEFHETVNSSNFRQNRHSEPSLSSESPSPQAEGGGRGLPVLAAPTARVSHPPWPPPTSTNPWGSRCARHGKARCFFFERNEGRGGRESEREGDLVPGASDHLGVLACSIPNTK